MPHTRTAPVPPTPKSGDDVLCWGNTIERGDGKEAELVTAQWLIHAQRDRLTPVWAKGHRGEPLHEGADALARLASDTPPAQAN